MRGDVIGGRPPGPSALPDLLRLRPQARPVWARLLCLVGAAVLVLAGIAGWLVPAVTGIPFYVAGLVLVALASNRVGGWINRLEQRLPEGWRRVLRRHLARIPSERLRHLVRLPGEEPPGPRHGG